MNDDRSSAPPASMARPVPSSTFATGAIRIYRDDALIERVGTRLRASVARPSRTSAIQRAAVALVLFGLGVGVGRGLPPHAADDARGPQATHVTAEASRAGTAMAPRTRPTEKREPKAPAPLDRIGRKRPASGPSIEPERGVPLVAGAAEVEALEQPLPTAADEAPPHVRASWLSLADAGDYAGALRELERTQVAQVVLATGSVEELMTMAEVARFAGNQVRAIQALSQVVDRYGRDPNAPLAAMMLGNLLSRSGDAAGAARAFALNRSLSPGGDFAEDALVREFDLALEAGNTELASRLFDQYAREFPAGPRVFAMRYELDELLASMPPADAEGPDGQRSDGQRSDGQRSDGQRSDGQRSDGQRSDGQRSDGEEPESPSGSTGAGKD